MQDIIKKAHLIIYRIRQRGLEVFLVNHDIEGEDWHLPQAPVNQVKKDAIELDSIKKDGATRSSASVIPGRTRPLCSPPPVRRATASRAAPLLLWMCSTPDSSSPTQARKEFGA